MKRNSIFLFAAMAATAVSMSSCSSEEMPDTNQQESPAELKITASMTASVEATRAGSTLQSTAPADFTSIGIYVWYKDATGAVSSPVNYSGYTDKVASYTGTGPYTLTPTTNPIMYFPINNSDVDVYLYAPYNPSPTQANMRMEHTVAADQSLTEGYLASDFIYGKETATYASKEASVTMHHAMSKIIFKIVNNGVDPNQMEEITLNNVLTKTTINMPQPIGSSGLTCGSAPTNNVAVASVRGNVIVWGTSGTGDVAIADTQTSGVAVILPPQTTPSDAGNEASISIMVDGKTATAEFKNITLDPGKVYTYNLKLIGQTLTIKLVSIQDWESGTTSDLSFDTWS